ncbi:MAG: SDR family NAD(P)-dependent oxidoreductase [Nitrososphaerota archaeon]|nr:SDR family NAD(P)-dependent oxidoreductase [Nitrososphaerota archaeon]
MSHQQNGPILVTGASSGVGRAICEFLASNGHSVYAGVRKQKDFEELAKLENVSPLQVDVTKNEEIELAVKQVHEWKRGLYGLVNCAGVAGVGPLLDTSIEEFNRVLGVNLIGVHRMVHAFGPMIVESRGRIVNLSSIGGFLVDTWLGPYGTSKHGLEGYDEVLREEMGMHGVQVITIEPGTYKSKIGTNFFDYMGDRINSAWDKSIFKDQMKQVIDWWVNTPGALDRTKWPEPTPIAEAVSDALFSDRPRSRYLVSDRETAVEVIDKMLRRVIEVNEGYVNPLSDSELAARFEKVHNLRR